MIKTVAKVVGALVALVIAYLTLRDRLPDLSDVAAAIRSAQPHWLLIAAVAEFAALAMFARLQRRVLAAFGVSIRLPRSLALAYGRTAITFSLPAGSAISAAYAFRQFRARGADQGTASAVLVICGLFSFGALLTLFAVGMSVPALGQLASTLGLPVTSALLGTLVTSLLLLGRTVARRRAGTRPQPSEPVATVPAPSRWPRLSRQFAELADAVRSARRIARRHWLLAFGAACGNWLADLLCLTATALAFGLPLEVTELALLYLTVQVVRQIPLTPGGIGVIEASLLAGLLSVGAAEPAAAAAVLCYRLLSCWLIIPFGLLAMALPGGRAGAELTADKPHSARRAARLPGTRREPRRAPRSHPSTAVRG
ncbi:hypothetical protein EV191_11337 [Tamaricihabitans halophyticus]|uniref:Lysylphosphatidylglycerol synthase-like protein n=1 Tax=Tamaricihabitans halophyticus TaxID=1262583 RepID=A0A4R2QIE5_9PSEU|nr:lysylphosphatidylglycerol synthase transmembrane domain-containing protein [Tamaricihabitans halophyticus]TCP46761.1 hypothetical protein EV191_11337 [Tamaricihabitans halophyticus]